MPVQRSLDDYFLEGAYRFQMQFGKCSFAEFFGPSAQNSEILAERRKWLAADERRYLQFREESEPLLAETLELARQFQTLPPEVHCPVDTHSTARSLGANWEPDYLLLTRTPESIRLAAGCVAFPSSWSLEEKMGLPIEEIHGVVPMLNSSIGRHIQTFLARLKPGTVWTRSNWGLSHSPELNQHPSRGLPKLHSEIRLNDVFFRVEEQALLALPGSNGILFGIRLRIIPLEQFVGQPAARKLHGALASMPREVAEYKGITRARETLLRLLESAA